MLPGQVETTPILTTDSGVAENICVLHNSPQLLDELASLVLTKKKFELILIDTQENGFLFPSEILFESSSLAKQLLEVEGILVFLTGTRAITITKESLLGDLSFHTFANYSELFDYSPSLTKHIQAVHNRNAILPENTDLTQQVLMSSVPILTESGIKAKGLRAGANKTNLVLSSVDNFTPVSALCLRLGESSKLTNDEILLELKSLEVQKLIYPLFAKVPFLVNCFRNRAPFTLKDYLLAAKLVSQTQLDELMIELGNKPVKEEASLGGLLLKKGFINARQLEIIMQDLAFYGQKAGLDSNKLIKASGEEAQLQTLVGYLGTTDPANLLQNFAQNRDTGVLSVEHRDAHFRAHFEEGKLTHVRIGKITGNKAILEFVSAWKEGIFVFIQRKPPQDLTMETCKLTKNLDKLLLESALAKDNMDQDMLALPKGLDIILEKLSDENKLLEQDGMQNVLKDPKDNTPISGKEVALMQRLWCELDGLTKLSDSIKRLGDVALYEGVRAAHLLVHSGLSHVPETDLAQPLAKFNLICCHICEKIGLERNLAFLRLSLRDALGYSARARLYLISSAGELGIDQAAAHSAHVSLSQVLQDVEDWQVKYIEYISQEINPDELMTLIEQVHIDTVK